MRRGGKQLIGWFGTGHPLRLERAFAGDRTLEIILGQIAHRNISHTFSRSRLGGTGETIDGDLAGFAFPNDRSKDQAGSDQDAVSRLKAWFLW